MTEKATATLSGAVADRTGYPILTYTGIVIYPLDASPDEIDIRDIAHATANICRYTGHVRSFYSVAEHCVRVAEYLEHYVATANDKKNLALEGLLHDASEAYIGDVARPIKASGEVGRLYGEAEDRLMNIIAEKFGTTWPMIDEVEMADYTLLRTEQRDLMPYPNELYDLEKEPTLTEKIRPWTPQETESEFLEAFERYTA